MPWADLKATGVEFAIIKATQSTGYTDPSFHSHLEGAKSVGILTGAYCYVHADRDPIVQAQHFFNVACPAGIDLPPFMDLEHRKELSAPAVIRMGYRFVVETERLWDKPAVVYSYANFLKSLEVDSRGDIVAVNTLKELAQRDLWIAHYTTGRPFVPAPFNVWKIHQFDGDGNRKLPNGVDSDYNYFNGDYDDLLAYCGRTPTRPVRTFDMFAPVEVPQAQDWVTTLADKES